MKNRYCSVATVVLTFISLSLVNIGCGQSTSKRSPRIGKGPSADGKKIADNDRDKDDNDKKHETIDDPPTVDACKGQVIDPGRVTMRRLNNFEYNNTVRDLFGTTLTPASDFPEDPLSHGMDNISDNLSMNPTLLSSYMNAAEALAKDAVARLFDQGTDNNGPLTGCASPLSDDACARTILDDVLPKIFRRSLTSTELQSYYSIVDVARQEGDSVQVGLELALQTALLSPHFIYRAERSIDPDDSEAVRKLDPYELASRLSYFIWGSTPDEELLDLAEKGTLNKDVVLAEQVNRMLSDSKAESFVTNFGDLWLGVRTLGSVNLDAEMYPEFSANIRLSMQTETRRFFRSLKENNSSILDLLNADYSFINETLADHYGIPGVSGAEFRRVKLPTNRRGFLTQGTFLVGTSKPYTTDPVIRGKFVLENFWCQEPPPPPADVSTVAPETPAGSSKKEILAVHRQSGASCKGCHVLMDPIGLGFENFSASGLWREKEFNKTIDPSGEFPSGKSFSNHLQLIDHLAKEPAFKTCVTKKFMMYATGRLPESSDSCAIKDIVRKVEDEDLKFASFVKAIVQSPVFRYSRGEKE